MALLGVCAVLIPRLPVCALAGFSLIGLGVANIVPIGFTAAGNAPELEPGRAIATVSLMGYFGLLIGPPAIGFLAQIISLPSALWLLAILLLAIIFLSADLVSIWRTSDSVAGLDREPLAEVEYPDVI